MTDFNRTRPRPRPKARLKDTPQADARATLGESSSVFPTSGVSRSIRVRDDDDDDEMFMRNKGRTNKAWERLDKLTKLSEAKVIHLESDSEDPDISTLHRKHQRATPPPIRQGNNALDRLLSVDLSDTDSESEIEIIGSSTTPRASKQAPRRKRRRTRSRSITPPPVVPLHHLQTARALVQQTLRTAPRPASPIYREDDDSDITTFSNPELARIAKSVAMRAHPQVPTSSPPPENTDTVQLSVKWKLHPLDEAGKEDIWVFKMNRDDNFRVLFEATAKEASILTESLIMTYNNKRIFSSVTPKTLQIWGEAELVACEKATYEFIRKIPVASSRLSFEPETTPTPDQPPEPETPSSQTTESVSDAEGDTFKLILRSKIVKDMTLTVRPTTKCGTIVKAFLKKAGIEDQYPGVFSAKDAVPNRSTTKGGRVQKIEGKDPRLRIDGDKMGNDVEIGEADLEDGDLVEVVDL